MRNPQRWQVFLLRRRDLRSGAKAVHTMRRVEDYAFSGGDATQCGEAPVLAPARSCQWTQV
jgi:hypothetical protein